MKKRLQALLCAVVVLFGVLLPAAAADDPLLLALNETMPHLTEDTIPIEVGGVVYVPISIFNPRVTNADLGVYAGEDKSGGTATLYSKDGTLVFDVAAGTAYDYSGETYNYRALSRNGRTYVPVRALYSYFGLSYSYLSTDYGPLVRIKNGEEALDDRRFVQSASSTIQSRLNEYWQNQAASETPTPSPGATAQVTPTPPPEGHNGVRVYLGIQVISGTRLEEILDALDRRSVYAVFFFSPQELEEYGDMIRRIAATGHQVGLVASWVTAEECQRQLDAGNRVLAQLARLNTRMVLLDGAEALRGDLGELGWLCWQSNVDGRSNGRSASRLTSAVMQGVGNKSASARVWMDDEGNSSAALPQILRRLQEEGYEIRMPVETEF